MMSKISTYWPLIKVVLTAALASTATTWQLLDSASFLRFCGVQ